jgi:hypothetical protein
MFNTSAGREQLVRLFPAVGSAESLRHRQAQQNFAGNGVAMFPAQSNDPSCQYPACNIEKICAIMTDTSIGDEVHRLAKLARTQVAWIDSLNAPEWKPRFGSPRLGSTEFFDYWGYQTCAEWGFYQTCEIGSHCFYTQGLVELEDFTSMCPAQFNISVDQVYKNVASSNRHYGGLEPLGPALTRNVSRIMWVNGDVDPWHALSVLEPPKDEAEQPTLMVSGASHHAWTHPSAPSDQKSVVAARKAIRTQVLKWLAEE